MEIIFNREQLCICIRLIESFQLNIGCLSFSLFWIYNQDTYNFFFPLLFIQNDFVALTESVFDVKNQIIVVLKCDVVRKTKGNIVYIVFSHSFYIENAIRKSTTSRSTEPNEISMMKIKRKSALILFYSLLCCRRYHFSNWTQSPAHNWILFYIYCHG